MCTTVPGRVLAVRGPMVEVDRQGRRAWFNALLAPGLRPGAWVSTHANLVVAELTPEEAAEGLRAWAEIAEEDDRQ